MAAVSGKYHIEIGGIGLLLARGARTERHQYQREEAPTFVNKFGSGDPNYRDGSFFSHWAQLDWLNGFDQEYWDDPGKFYRSDSVDTTDSTKLTLQKKIESAGQPASGVTINCFAALPDPDGLAWADSNYNYRKQLTITAPAGQNMPSGYPIKITEDTAALETAGKVRSDRKDWRVYYYDGTSWTDLTRHYVGTSETWFALQAALNGGASTRAYYIYYGYASESSEPDQPSLDKREVNETSLLNDANLQGYWRMQGNSNDGSSNTNNGSDTDITYGDAYGKFSNGATFNGSTSAIELTTDATLKPAGNFTVSAWVKTNTGAGTDTIFASYSQDPNRSGFYFAVVGSGGVRLLSGVNTGVFGIGTDYQVVDGDISVIDDRWHFVAGVYNGSTLSVYVDGVLDKSVSWSNAPVYAATTYQRIGCQCNGGTNSNFWSGELDDVAIWDRALTDEEIRSLYTGRFNRVYIPTLDEDVRLLALNTETSGTTVYDIAGGHDITLQSGASIDTSVAKFANAMQFESANSEYGEITDHVDLRLTGNYTIECWIKTTQTGTGTIFQSYSNSAYPAGIALEINNGSANHLAGVQGNGATGSSYNITNGSTTINDGNWHHVAMTWDGTNMKLFVDGVQDASEAYTTAPTYNTTSYVRVGCRNNAGTNLNFFNGHIAGLRVINGTAKTSFPYAVVTSDPTVSIGEEAEEASAGALGGARIFAGCDDGKVYEWLGGTSWSEAHDTSNNSVNCMTLATFSNTTYLYIGSGNPDSTTDGGAKVHRTSDGDSFTDYTISGSGTTGASLSMAFWDNTLFVGTGPQAIIISSTDGTTFSTVAKDIGEPNNPGYVYAMAIYNNSLFAAGGHPENFRTSNSNGFLYRWDGFEWRNIYPFDFTVVKSMAVYDSLLFMGTIHGHLYVFNTASIDKLMEFEWDVSIEAMTSYDDKLALALGPTDSNNVTGEEGVYLFDRNGLHKAFSPNVSGVYALINNNNLLLLGTGSSGNTYKTISSAYEASGWLQTSYHEAQLPSIDKLYREVDLYFDALPAGASIKVEYRHDESEDWSTLGTASTDGDTSESFEFPTNTSGKKLSLKITLATSSETSTPTLRKSIVRYVLAPDFKYIWKMNIACPDDIIWQDDTRPVSKLGAEVSAADATITLNDVGGFPDPSGDKMYATIVDNDGNEDRFYYTGISGSTLTGIPTTGDFALSAHASTEIGVSKVMIRGRDLHKAILELKQTKKFYTLTDIDGNTYTVYFHAYSTEGWVIDPVNKRADVGDGVLENEVPITLLEA